METSAMITQQAIGKKADQAAAKSQRNIDAMHRAFEQWKAEQKKGSGK
jgi:hypothetical protein